MKRYPWLFVLATAGWSQMAVADGITLYGLLDAGVGYSRQDGSDSDLTLDSGVSEDSRFGIRGTEALGSGLTAKFELESGIDLGTGTPADEGRFFDRAAWVGIEGGFGDLRLGRQATFAHDWFGEVSPFENDFKQAGVTNIFGFDAVGERIDNAVFYRLPEFGGFEAGVGYSFNAEGPEVPGQENRVLTVGLRYTAGALVAVAAYELGRDADQDAAPGRADIRNLSVGATYEFSQFKLHAGYGRLKNRDYIASALTEKAWLVGATVSVGPGEVLAAYQRVAERNTNEFGLDSTRDGVALAYLHPLSKRTTLYAYGSRFRNIDERGDDPARLADRTQVGAGVRHVF
jgi:predicted porin